MDDSPYNLFILEEILKSLHLDIEITRAMNGHEAIELIKEQVGQHNSQYDFVLMDLHMPVIDGF